MSDADAVIAVLRKGHDELAGFVGGLSDDDLARGSGAAEWDVSEVLSHLGSGAEIGLAGLDAALAGTPRPGQEFNLGVWDRWNAMGRRERADGFVRADEALVERYESIDAATRESLRIDMGFLPAPVDVATAARLRLNEFAMHMWDVRAGFADGVALSGDAAAALLHGEPNLLAWIGKAEALGGREAVVRVTTSGPESVFALRLAAPISVDFDVPGEPDGTLDLPAESWLRLVAGRLGPRHTPEGVTATGAADLDLLRRVFPGY
jgi:uncharacterized protein (TIGR03083 family)